MSNSKIFISRDFKCFRVINVKHETFTDMPANYSNSSIIIRISFKIIYPCFNLLILSLFLFFLMKDYKLFRNHWSCFYQNIRLLLLFTTFHNNCIIFRVLYFIYHYHYHTLLAYLSYLSFSCISFFTYYHYFIYCCINWYKFPILLFFSITNPYNFSPLEIHQTSSRIRT